MPEQKHRAIITGSAARVGRATAVEFARRGLDITLAVRADNDAARESAMLCRAAARDAGRAEPEVLIECAELDDLNAVQAMGTRLAARGVDVIVHCASRYEAQSFGSITPEHAMSHMRVNALAPLLLTQAVAPQLAKSGIPSGGAVVCFSDMHVAGRLYKNHASYFASKGALDALIGALALELAPQIRVNGIAPGVVAWPVNSDPEMMRRYIERTPLARGGTPEEAARCAAWLALEATYICGEIIRLDGGRWLR
jgi:pteridine reductase